MYDSWSGTWSTQDIYRGTIQEPMSLHRTAFVNNNPINFYDPDGFDGLSFSITDKGLILSYSNSKYTPESGQVGMDFSLSLGNNDGVHTFSGSLDLVQQNNGHSSSLSAVGDAAIGFNSKGDFAAMAGGAVLLTRDGKVIFRKSGSIGNKAGYNALGYNDAGHYNAEAIKRVEANRDKAMQNLKRESDQNIREYEEQQERLEKSYGDSAYLGYLDSANNFFDSTGKALENGNMVLGNNGKVYFQKANGYVFNGNQYVSTVQLSKVGRGIVRISGPVAVGVGALEIVDGVKKDNGEFGPNAQLATAEVAGSTVGALAGFEAGFEAGATVGGGVGSFFAGAGAIPGAAIGGVIGGIAGGITGAYYGGEAAGNMMQNQ